MRSFMEVAMGTLNWTPSQFWKSTPLELNAAIKGWLRMQPKSESTDKKDVSITPEEEAYLKEKYGE